MYGSQFYRFCRRVLYKTERKFSTCPLLYTVFAILKVASGPGRDRVRRETDIVIEGFPRCGNSFAVAAFRYAQQEPLSIAHHLHAPHQIICAVKRGIPCICLIREPVEAVASLTIRNPLMSLEDYLRDYLQFYLTVWPYTSSVVIAPFSILTTDFGTIIKQVNAEYRTSFSHFQHNKDNVEKCIKHVKEMSFNFSQNSILTPPEALENSMGAPSADREQHKEMIREQILKERYVGLLSSAQNLYQSFVDKSFYSL